MSEEKTLGGEKLAVDARLLSEAVIEFNISRKNVGLYPPGHIRITNAIDKAFGHITKLFEYRSSITLGITKNSLIIDNKALDSRNPVYRECAMSFHDLGIAGITFQAGLEKSELVRLHEIMTRKDPPRGKSIVEAAQEAGINRLKLSPIDHTSFKFISGKTRDGGGDGGETGSGRDTTEDYVYGLLEGKLAGGGIDDSQVLLGLNAEDVAAAIEKSKAKDEQSYDNVISAYLSKTDKDRLSPLAMSKIVGVMENLSEEARQQFLSRASSHLANDASSVEKTLRNMPASEIEKITDFFSKKSSGLPDSLKNVIDKLSTLSSDKGKFTFDMQTPQGTLLHDIDMGDSLKHLFADDNFESYVSTGYKKQLDRMLAAPVDVIEGQIRDLEKECHPDVVDQITSEIMLEVITHPSMNREDYLNIITTLSNQATDFVMTGRFDEALNIYNVVYAHTFGSSFEHEARGSVDYYFRSEGFTEAVLSGSKVWGRTNRKGIALLIRALNESMVPPLIGELAEEPAAAARKYIIQLLADVGDSIVPEVIAKLTDRRWYVQRNMLYLLRLVGRQEHAEQAVPFMRHKDGRVVFEALGALLALGHKQAVPYLRSVLSLTDPKKRDVGVKLADMFKVRAVRKELTEILEIKDSLSDEDLYKPSVIKALGQIGDVQAVPHIARALRVKSLLKRGPSLEIQKAIYLSLSGYPFDTVRELAETGLRSNNDEIKAICARIINGQKGDEGR